MAVIQWFCDDALRVKVKQRAARMEGERGKRVTMGEVITAAVEAYLDEVRPEVVEAASEVTPTELPKGNPFPA